MFRTVLLRKWNVPSWRHEEAAGCTKYRTVTPESCGLLPVRGWQQKCWLRLGEDSAYMKSHALMLKKCISFLILSSAAALYFHSFWNTPVSLRLLLPNTQATLIGQLTQAWASTAHHVSGQCLQLPVHICFTVNVGRDYANVWHSDIVWCNEVT